MYELSGLEPILLFEIEKHTNAYPGHDPEQNEIAPSPFEFRHEVEIHSVHPCNEGQGYEYGADDGEKFHYLIHPVA